VDLKKFPVVLKLKTMDAQFLGPDLRILLVLRLLYLV